MNSTAVESAFFTTHYLSAADLKKGDKVLIGWAPNRLITLQYDGDDSFIVLASENSKLLTGDRFLATHFLLGYPLYIDRIQRGDGTTPSFVAGKNGGLNRLEKV